jgi:hypothetical protein
MSDKGWFREHTGKAVITAIVGALVLALFPSVRDFAFSLPGHVWAFLGWLGEPVQTTRWVFWTLTLSVIALVGLVLVGLAATVINSHRAYTTDTFFGVVWRWTWTRGRPIGSDDLNPYCPKCDRWVTLQEEDRYGNDFTHVVCEACGIDSVREGTRHQFRHEVIREIDLKLRNGEWKKAVKRVKETTP